MGYQKWFSDFWNRNFWIYESVFSKINTCSQQNLNYLFSFSQTDDTPISWNNSVIFNILRLNLFWLIWLAVRSRGLWGISFSSSSDKLPGSWKMLGRYINYVGVEDMEWWQNSWCTAYCASAVKGIVCRFTVVFRSHSGRWHGMYAQRMHPWELTNMEA